MGLGLWVRDNALDAATGAAKVRLYLLTVLLKLATHAAIGWDMLTLAGAAKIQVARRWIVRKIYRA